MSSFDIFIARYRFNFEAQINRFLTQNNVDLKSLGVFWRLYCQINLRI